MPRFALALLSLAFALAAACGSDAPAAGGGSQGTGGDAGTQADAGTPSGVVAITLSQTDVHLPAGANTAFAVTGTYNDGSRHDLTPQADAVSSDTKIVTLQNGPGSQIQIFAHDAGTATITVTLGALKAYCNVTVAPR